MAKTGDKWIMKAGDRLWNGAIATPYLADAYNSLQARIASFEKEGRKPPEYLLNGAHNLLNSALK